MCSRHAPENGADSDWTPHPFRVLVEDYDGTRLNLGVNAIGFFDASNQAKEKARDLGYDVVAVLRVEEVAA
jgi:hypothetical protein